MKIPQRLSYALSLLLASSSLLTADNDLSFPEEGRWSVATGWENQWPTDWRHAKSERHEEVGGWTIHYAQIELPSGVLELQDNERKREDGLTEVLRRWTWTGETDLKSVTLSVRTQIEMIDSRPFFPSISYYDNPAGQTVNADIIPVIGTKPGDKGFFEEHRFSMPFAALEGKQGDSYVSTALHSLPSSLLYGDKPDQWWSLGMERLSDSRVELALLSGPVASNGKNGIIKGKKKGWFEYPDATLTLKPGAVVQKTFYIQSPTPTKRGSGFRAPIKATLDMADLETPDAYPAYSEVLQQKIIDSLRRWRETDDHAGIHFHPTERKKWFEFGWAAQSDAFAYPMITMGDAYGVENARHYAQASLDFLSNAPFTKEGFSVSYDYGNKKWVRRRNPLSQGQGMQNMLNALGAAREAGGYDTSKWEAFLNKACKHHAGRILADEWNPKSTNEGFLIAPLVKGSELLEKPRYLKAAVKAADHYLERHLSMDEPYWGGTLDATCEDKEGAWAALQGFLEVYRVTKDKRYLEGAEHAGDVVLSYMYTWDVAMPPGRLADNGFTSRGWTSVSAQNHHLDVYGVLCAPAFYQLGELTGQDVYKKSAKLLSVPCGQLTDPWGAAGEQLHQTNYAQHYDYSDLKGVRGGYEEGWDIYWISAHFLTAAAQFKEMGVDCLTW
ncbi:MAG: hypothetical protein AAGA58_06630 [Verrucomicrobiota bacterium]